MSERPPNVLVILPDQLGARWAPAYGNSVVHAPRLDQFARQSVIFDRAITTSPICTPYRGCLLSGRYPSQTGVRQNGQAYPREIPSLADRLNDAGYATHWIGKWHLGGSPQCNRRVEPDQRAGFQHFIGWESHHVDHYAGLIWHGDETDAREMPGHETDALTDIALDQLRVAAAGDQPFFMLVSYQAPHPPCNPPGAFRALYAGSDLLPEPNADQDAWYRMPHWKADYDVNEFRERYFGEISHLDAAFGRLLDALDSLAISGETLVMFTSDHGEMAGAHGSFGKGVMYEEALHVPLIIRPPGQNAAGGSSTPVATIDLLPTLLDYAGATSDAADEGISLRRWIEGAEDDAERVVISEFKDYCALDGRWKLITAGRSLEAAALYDIANDPFELDNRVACRSAAEIVERLRHALSDWEARLTPRSQLAN